MSSPGGQQIYWSPEPAVSSRYQGDGSYPTTQQYPHAPHHVYPPPPPPPTLQEGPPGGVSYGPSFPTGQPFTFATHSTRHHGIPTSVSSPQLQTLVHDSGPVPHHSGPSLPHPPPGAAVPQHTVYATPSPHVYSSPAPSYTVDHPTVFNGPSLPSATTPADPRIPPLVTFSSSHAGPPAAGPPQPSSYPPPLTSPRATAKSAPSSATAPTTVPKQSLTRPNAMRHRSVSANSGSRNTAHALSTHCTHCGVDVQAVAEQMETARRKLELLQEKVDVDQALLDQEQKNFKRRLHAVKLSVKKTQRDAALKERQRQLDWADLSKQTDVATQQRLRVQQQEYESKLLEAETEAQHQAHAHQTALDEWHTRLDNLQTALDEARHERETLEQRVAQLHEQQSQVSLPVSLPVSNASVVDDDERMGHLERTLEAKTMALESLEMQLLELERDRDVSGSGTATRGHNETAEWTSATVTSLNRQLSDAQLQIATLLNRQTVTDQKLAQERLKNDEVRHTMDQATAASAERQQNDQSLRLAKELKELQQQLKQAKSREQEQRQHSQLLEQKLVVLQEQNETLEAKVDEMNATNSALHDQVQVEQEKADLALVMAEGTKRAVEDSASGPRVIDVLSGIIPDACAPLDTITTTTIASTASRTYVISDQDVGPNRKYVVEYEWLGPQWSGVYTGELSIVTNHPDGDGTLRVDDGAVYNGEWRNGKPHGSGVWATIEGDLHCSYTWSDGVKHGPTVDVLCDGSVYRGMYVNGQRHGPGILTWPYGAHYTGQFDKDKRNGEGVYRYPDGRCYTGTYQDDRPHGYGVLKAVDGTVLYDGMWQLGEFIGSL